MENLLSYFDHIVGNDQIKKYLSKSFETKHIANSLLFTGQDGVGKALFARAFADLVFSSMIPGVDHRKKIEKGSHPNVLEFYPEGKIGMHSIDSMRALTEEVYLPPHESPYRFFIVHDAERMLAFSANALLKTFEEPASQSIIILLSSAPQNILPTILSRCYTLRFRNVAENALINFIQKKWDSSFENARKIAEMSFGSIGRAHHLIDSKESKIQSKVLALLSSYRQLSYPCMLDLIKEIDELLKEEKKQLEDEAQERLSKKFPQETTKIQQETLEKEIEGAVAMKISEEVNGIFETILAWHRDMHLLQVNGNKSLLIHKDYQEKCTQSFERGEMLTLEHVEKSIAAAKLLFLRSTPFESCLENLFLNLSLFG